MTLRSAFLGRLQAAEKDGLSARFEEVSLAPVAMAQIPAIIKGPAKVAGLEVEEAFVQQAAADAETEEALPLLAFALRELNERFGGDGHLSLADYQALGDAQAALSPLENAVRRPARLDALPTEAQPLQPQLVNALLLISREEEGHCLLEVAQEALLRKWPLLRAWLDEDREFPIGSQQLEVDLQDWQKAGEQQRSSRRASPQGAAESPPGAGRAQLAHGRGRGRGRRQHRLVAEGGSSSRPVRHQCRSATGHRPTRQHGECPRRPGKTVTGRSFHHQPDAGCCHGPQQPDQLHPHRPGCGGEPDRAEERRADQRRAQWQPAVFSDVPSCDWGRMQGASGASRAALTENPSGGGSRKHLPHARIPEGI